MCSECNAPCVMQKSTFCITEKFLSVFLNNHKSDFSQIALNASAKDSFHSGLCSLLSHVIQSWVGTFFMFQNPAADFIFFVCPVFVFCLKNKQTLLAVICVFILKWMLTAESCLEWTSYANIWADCCKYYCTTHKVSFRRSRLKPDYWLKRALSVLLWIFHLNLKFSSLCCNTDSAGNWRCKDVFLHIQTIIFCSLE